MNWILELFKKQPSRWELEEQAARAACDFEHRLTKEEAKAIAELLDVARQVGDLPVPVYFGGEYYTITKNKISHISDQ